MQSDLKNPYRNPKLCVQCSHHNENNNKELDM